MAAAVRSAARRRTIGLVGHFYSFVVEDGAISLCLIEVRSGVTLLFDAIKVVIGSGHR